MSLAKQLDYWQAATERWRETAFLPFLKLCRRFGISANQVTTLRIILAAPFPFLIADYPSTAWWLIAVSIFLDAVDGTVARFLKTASDRGKFIDVLADHLTFILIGLGLMRALPPFSTMLAVLTIGIPCLYLIAYVADNERGASDWIITAKARLIGYKIAFLAIVICHMTGAWEEATTRSLLVIETVAVVAHFIWHYWRFVSGRNLWHE